VGGAKTFTGILRREMYIGQLIWNRRKSKKEPGTSRRVYEIRPQSEWEIQSRPNLRIVDDALWKRVQARLSQKRQTAHKKNKQPRGRPSRYLLSGILKCGECGANFIMQDARAYGCSSHTNGGRHLCSNDIRVKRGIAENALLENVKNHLLSDDVVKYMRQSVRVAIREYQKSAKTELKSVDRLKSKRREIDERRSIQSAIADAKQAKPWLDAIPDILPGLVDAWREIVGGMADIASNPHARASDVQEARGRLHALLGPVVLEPRDGVLWAHPSPNAKSLVETRLSGRLHINSQILVAGARFALFLRSRIWCV
jgi:hypothetical protein